MEKLASKKEEKKPWEDIPLEIIIEDKKRREIDRDRERPRIYEYDTDIPYQKPEEKKKKEQERGVWIIKLYS